MRRGRHVVCVQVDAAERALVAQAARRAGLSVSDYVREAINNALAEGGDVGDLRPRPIGRPRIVRVTAHG